MSITISEQEKKVQQHNEDEYTYTPRKRNTSGKEKGRSDKKKAETSKAKKKINKLAIIIPVSVILVLFLAFTAYTLMLPKNKVSDNVVVAGMNVGQMNTEELKAAVSDIIKPDEIFTVVSGGKEAQIKSSDINLEVNIEETVNNAMEIGKKRNPFVNLVDSVKLLFVNVELPLVLDYDEELLNQMLFDFGTTINGVSTEPEYIFGDNTITIKPGTPGQNHDTSKALSEFIAAVSTGKKDNIAVTLDYAEIQKLNADEVYKEIVNEPLDASYEKAEDGTITVKDGAVGVKLEKSKLEAAINEVNEGREVTFEAEVTQPTKTTEDLKENLFSTTLGSFSSNFSSSSANRAFNVSRAANSIDGIILMPGESFSYNKAIGNPSAKNGYKMASVFVNGKTAEGVGGGVCQVSSTLYSAVLYADLTVTERHNHSLTVDYVPKGQDATVSYGSLDFQFKNNTDYPVKISSKIDGRKLTVSIIGGKYKDNRKVEISNQLISTIAPTETITEDATLAPGTRKVISSGKNGYVYDTYKTVYKNGVKDSSKKITRSTYKMTPAEVAVGTGTAVDTSVPSEGVDIGGLKIDMPSDNEGEQPAAPVRPEQNAETQAPSTTQTTEAASAQSTEQEEVVPVSPFVENPDEN